MKQPDPLENWETQVEDVRQQLREATVDLAAQEREQSLLGQRRGAKGSARMQRVDKLQS